MKLIKSIFLASSITLLGACSTINSITSYFTFDSADKSETALSSNETSQGNILLKSGGIQLPAQDPNFTMPNISNTTQSEISVRPPLVPMAIIPNSYANYNGEGAFIIFLLDQQKIYNLTNVARVLKDDNINSTLENNTLVTDFVSFEEDDQIISIQYQIIQEVKAQGAGIIVGIKTMKINGEVVKPTTLDKQYYTASMLNKVIGTLHNEYQKQKQALAN